MIANTSFQALFFAERATVAIVNPPALLSMQYPARDRRVLVARQLDYSLVCTLLMGPASRTGIFLIGAALLLSISCEEHHLGEYPEVQRELMTVSKNPEPAPAGSATATPVKFFPEKRP